MSSMESNKRVPMSKLILIQLAFIPPLIIGTIIVVFLFSTGFWYGLIGLNIFLFGFSSVSEKFAKYFENKTVKSWMTFGIEQQIVAPKPIRLYLLISIAVMLNIAIIFWKVIS